MVRNGAKMGTGKIEMQVGRIKVVATYSYSGLTEEKKEQINRDLAESIRREMK